MATADPLSALSYAVRPRAVLKYLGQVALILGLLGLPPLIVALVHGETRPALWYAGVALALAAAGAVLVRLPAPAQLQVNEALCIIVLSFLLGALAMTVPLAAAGLGFVDAFFEAMSGITTTGLSVLPGVDRQPRSLLFTRAWMQWYGGLGIAVLVVGLLMRHGAATVRLAEAPAGENIVSTVRAHARRVVLVYLVLSLAALGIVWAAVGEPFTALTHAMAAVSTGGFSTFEESLAGLPPAAAGAIVAFGLLGAVSLPLYYRAFYRGAGSALRDPELRALLALALAVGLLLALLLVRAGHLPWPEALRHGLLLGASAQSTTGFSTLNVGALDAGAKLVLVLAMLTGGSLGSTAGGIKLLRMLMLARLVQLALARTAVPPHAVLETRLGGVRLEDDDLVRALLVATLFGAVVLASWLVFVLAGYPPLDALLEVVSATGTVGLSSGITRPELEPALKAVLCFDMLAGRVEVLALLVVLYPRTWFGKRERLT